MQTIDVWNGDWGAFEVPVDVPRIFRSNGWFDLRYQITEDLKRYFADMDERMRDSLPVLSWAAWNKGVTPLWFWEEAY